ncbi:peptide chain release factor N(5)-glutamine methyltransferase [Novosphingobium sp. Gsoil 351]|uniref:peptide chain release factor N(5)-glutamine methyltransferase n=1 Tax=Novosphingobium sp. Gsoil 351 TaxID=2675225 RepID=UPI0012B4EE4D|nr:peptide chain release factor N(5)-glutamine methyltransferase [Novosphingobium sp. Gsoil 351]QGN54673.1 peptide chain release factor N(5)-glutamine methyltransferase [Novosphingobium sp. Gsoil 351]
MTVALAIREAAEVLARVSDTPRLDAELLMAHVLGLSRPDMLIRAMRDPVPAGIAGLVVRRLNGEPVAYIVGSQDFLGRSFRVGPGVLIPRADSETTVLAALAACPAPRRVLDCGVGSGALLLTVLAERPGALGVGIDRSPEAVAIARENAGMLALAAATMMQLGDWNRPGWAADLGRFDLILANPPYVEDGAALDPQVRDHEPAGALFAGADGLDAYRALIPQLPALIEDGGVAVVEIGATQADAVAALAHTAGFAAELHRDLANRPRALALSGLGKKPLGKARDPHYLETKPAGG